ASLVVGGARGETTVGDREAGERRLVVQRRMVEVDRSVEWVDVVEAQLADRRVGRVCDPDGETRPGLVPARVPVGQRTLGDRRLVAGVTLLAGRRRRRGGIGC